MVVGGGGGGERERVRLCERDISMTVAEIGDGGYRRQRREVII